MDEGTNRYCGIVIVVLLKKHCNNERQGQDSKTSYLYTHWDMENPAPFWKVYQQLTRWKSGFFSARAKAAKISGLHIWALKTQSTGNANTYRADPGRSLLRHQLPISLIIHLPSSIYWLQSNCAITSRVVADTTLETEMITCRWPQDWAKEAITLKAWVLKV